MFNHGHHHHPNQSRRALRNLHSELQVSSWISPVTVNESNKIQNRKVNILPLKKQWGKLEFGHLYWIDYNNVCYAVLYSIEECAQKVKRPIVHCCKIYHVKNAVSVFTFLLLFFLSQLKWICQASTIQYTETWWHFPRCATKSKRPPICWVLASRDIWFPFCSYNITTGMPEADIILLQSLPCCQTFHFTSMFSKISQSIVKCRSWYTISYACNEQITGDTIKLDLT